MATIQYSEKTKEELIALLLQKDQRIKELEDKITELNKKNQPKFVKASLRRKRKKKPGRKHGHLGITRTKPDQIDEIILSKLTTCPCCNGHLGDAVESYDHIQEDIIPARIKVTCYRKFRYWCNACNKMVTAPYHDTEIPHSYLGPNILIQALLLKYHHHLPYGSIKELFMSFAHLTVTESALAQGLQRLSRWLAVEKDAILAAIRSSPLAHMDETGWRIDGVNHWIWDMVNQRLAYYQIDRSRSSRVAQAMLGENFKGTLITDFYSAYRRVRARMQKCLVHLLREMDRCRVSDRSDEFACHYKRLKRIMTDAQRLKKERPRLAPWIFYRRLRLLKERLLDFACRPFQNKNWQRLSKRLLTHYEELLTFVEHPAIPADNNHAERMIRPHVINRNRSFGNRSYRGAEAHTTLMSILHSLRLQDKNLTQSLKIAYLAHRKGFQPAMLF